MARQVHELVRRLITRMIEDVIARSEGLIAACSPDCADDIRLAGTAAVAFSPAMAAADRTIKSFTCPHLYRHPRIIRIMGEAEAVVRSLFERYQRDPQELPSASPVGIVGHVSAGPRDCRFHRRDDRSLRAFRAYEAL